MLLLRHFMTIEKALNAVVLLEPTYKEKYIIEDGLTIVLNTLNPMIIQQLNLIRPCWTSFILSWPTLPYSTIMGIIAWNRLSHVFLLRIANRRQRHSTAGYLDVFVVWCPSYQKSWPAVLAVWLLHRYIRLLSVFCRNSDTRVTCLQLYFT